MEYILQANNVSFDYITKAGIVNAVKNVSVDFEQGKLYVIIGRSGSGKSTFLSLLAGLEQACSGEVLFQGKNLSSLDKDKYRRESIGMVFQSFYLLPQLTALENIKLSLQISNYEGNITERALQLLKEVGLTEFHGKKRSTHLSGGEQQRVAIARALAPSPPVILADEPTGNLDSENGRNIISILKKLAHDENRCVVIITHAAEVAAEADVLLSMKDGELS